MKEGRFTTIQWDYFLEWCIIERNRIIVDSRMHYDVICTSFPLYCNICELESLEVVLDIHDLKDSRKAEIEKCCILLIYVQNVKTSW